jgi:hypothetical protein
MTNGAGTLLVAAQEATMAMGRGRRVAAALLVGVALVQSGCTFFAAGGGGALRREELGDWLGMAPMAKPDAQRLKGLMAELRAVPNRPFGSTYSLRGDANLFSANCNEIIDVPFTPAPGLRIKGRLNPWLRFVPGSQHGDWLYYDERDATARRFYASEDEWDALVAWGERVDCWEAASLERVAARAVTSVPGLGLGWTRVRKIRPVDATGVPGLNTIAYSKRSLSEAQYDARDGSIVLLGALGWGRVNRRRYLQILWLPIPVGRVRP